MATLVEREQPRHGWRAWVAHVRAMVRRYNAARGNQLAGAMTYFGFLSLFPLIAIAFAVVGYLVRVYPDARAELEALLQENLPGLVGPGGIDVGEIAAGGEARVAAGLGGAAGLLYSGLGWIESLRQSLRTVWAVAPDDRNIVIRKATDLLVLVALGGTVLLTTAVSSVATASTSSVLDLLGLSSGRAASVLLQVLAVVLVIVANTVVLTVVFTRLPGHRLPWRNTWTGALLGAVGIEVLKQVATLLLTGTSTNPVYGAFAGVVTVLVWINTVSRVVVYAAAWSVTGPVPTVEADVAAHGERLDADAAAAAERAREEHDDGAVVPLDTDHRTTAGEVGLTTTGIDRKESG